MQSPNSIGNAFLHLRRGQVLFEIGRTGEAADELTRAYMSEGEEVFRDEDPRYRDFLRGILRPPRL